MHQGSRGQGIVPSRQTTGTGGTRYRRRHGEERGRYVRNATRTQKFHLGLIFFALASMGMAAPAQAFETSAAGVPVPDEPDDEAFDAEIGRASCRGSVAVTVTGPPAHIARRTDPT